jgi:hypothetical protein
MRPILYTGTLLMAASACTGVVAAPDEGAGSSTGVAVCSSNVYWKEMDTGSELMHPGGKCKTCHEMNLKAPLFKGVAGTVYPTSHEPDDCNGVAGVVMDGGLPDPVIIVTDRTGRTLPGIAVNSAGNFKVEGEILMPFNVKVVYKGKENKMMMQAPHGDCNACHTQKGANTQGGDSAPGRIIVP